MAVIAKRQARMKYYGNEYGSLLQVFKEPLSAVLRCSCSIWKISGSAGNVAKWLAVIKLNVNEATKLYDGMFYNWQTGEAWNFIFL